MIGIVGLAVIFGGAVVILGLLVVVVALLWTRSRRRERERRWRQLDSVYNNRDRRERGN